MAAGTGRDGLLDRLGTAAGDAQDEVLLQTARLVSPHAYAEEPVLWPVMRAVLPDGDALTLRVEQAHQQINEAPVSSALATALVGCAISCPLRALLHRAQDPSARRCGDPRSRVEIRGRGSRS